MERERVRLGNRPTHHREGSPSWQWQAAAGGSKRAAAPPPRFSPPEIRTASHGRRAELVALTKYNCRRAGYQRCASIKGHMIQILVGPRPKAIAKAEWGSKMTKEQAERFVHRLAHKGYMKYRDDWTDLFGLQQAIPCAGGFDSGCVGGGCPWKHTYNLNEAMREQEASGSVGKYTEQWEMDHSLQPLCRTMQLWKVCPPQDLLEEKLLHLIYAVKPAIIDGVPMHAAVFPRCVSCHATWQENHGQIWQVQRQQQ